MYDIIIIGGGPAGICAAIYCLRAGKKVLILEKEIVGGKIASSPLVENYPGIRAIKGSDLSNELYQQIVNLGGEIKMNEAVAIKDLNVKKQVMTKNNLYECKCVIIATGTKYKTLGLDNEKNFIGKGISFCATCDGFFYKNKNVAVIGGGNTAISNALELSNLCNHVYLLQMINHLTGENILIDRLKQKDNVEIIYNTTIKKIIGEEKITAIEIEKNNKNDTLSVDGIFISIGQIPETDIVKQNVDMSKEHFINVDKQLMTTINGVFAAGDCVNKEIRQLTTAVNDGTIAALNAIEFIDKHK